MNPEIATPQFDRVVDELREFSMVMDEAIKAVDTARGLDAAEARRCFFLAAARLQEAGYWFGEGLKFAHKAGKK
jgi:hypothetical protein